MDTDASEMLDQLESARGIVNKTLQKDASLGQIKVCISSNHFRHDLIESSLSASG
jgi:ribosomal protein L16/L10AE